MGALSCSLNLKCANKNMGDIMEEITYQIIETNFDGKIGFGFELMRGEVAFQRQIQGSNSEIWTKEEAEASANEALAYWAQFS